MRLDVSLTTAAGVMVFAAASLTAVNVRNALFPPSTKPIATVSGWRAYAAVGQRVGSEGAPVTLTAFFDYQCPFSRKLHDSVAVLQDRYGDHLTVVWRHYPLQGHEFAEAAAEAALCAGEQASFPAIHEVLFAKSRILGSIPWSQVAREANVGNVNQFDDCMTDERARTALERDVEAAGQLGVRGTPTFLVNSSVFAGVPADLDDIVERELRRVATQRTRQPQSTH